MRRVENYIKIFLPALSINEGVARNTVASFVAQLNPSLEELLDIKCAVSEAVTNSIVHGYPFGDGQIILEAEIHSQEN